MRKRCVSDGTSVSAPKRQTAAAAAAAPPLALLTHLQRYLPVQELAAGIEVYGRDGDT